MSVARAGRVGKSAILPFTKNRKRNHPCLAMVYKSLAGRFTCVDYGQQQIHPNEDIENLSKCKAMSTRPENQTKSNSNQTKSPANTPTFVTILSLRRKLHRPVEIARGKQAQSCRNKYQQVENFNNFRLKIIETVQTWSMWSRHIGNHDYDFLHQKKSLKRSIFNVFLIHHETMKCFEPFFSWRRMCKTSA